LPKLKEELLQLEEEKNNLDLNNFQIALRMSIDNNNSTASIPKYDFLGNELKFNDYQSNLLKRFITNFAISSKEQITYLPAYNRYIPQEHREFKLNKEKLAAAPSRYLKALNNYTKKNEAYYSKRQEIEDLKSLLDVMGSDPKYLDNGEIHLAKADLKVVGSNHSKFLKMDSPNAWVEICVEKHNTRPSINRFFTLTKEECEKLTGFVSDKISERIVEAAYNNMKNMQSFNLSGEEVVNIYNTIVKSYSSADDDSSMSSEDFLKNLKEFKTSKNLFALHSILLKKRANLEIGYYHKITQRGLEIYPALFNNSIHSSPDNNQNQAKLLASDPVLIVDQNLYNLKDSQQMKDSVDQGESLPGDLEKVLRLSGYLLQFECK
jgi:hypothetical protein